MDRNNKDLKKAFEKIEIPQELNDVVNSAIRKGRKDMKKSLRNKRLIKITSGIAAVLAIFALSINSIPAFADNVSNLPGGGKLVQILKLEKERGDNENRQGLENEVDERNNSSTEKNDFADNNEVAENKKEHKNMVQGGEITDGTDVEFISWLKNGSNESININFGAEGAPTYMANYFEVTYSEFPYSMLVSIPGARGFSAADSFPEFIGSDLVEDIYRIVTLDDSMQRFVVTFKKPVVITVKEYKDPAQVSIELSEDSSNANLETVYSLRSKSYPFSEVVGSIEERLKYEFDSKDVRLLQDRNGTYFVEEGYYKTEKETQARKLQLLEKEYMDIEFFIEMRGPKEIPKAIKG